MEQHYRLTLSDAIAKYQAGDLTAKGLVHFYILIRCRPGWKIRLEHQKVCKELGIAKTAFYNSISRLREEGSIDWEAPSGILVSISSTFRECGMDSTSAETESANAESDSTSAETESANAESDSASAETKSSEPLISEPFGDSPDLLTNSYQFFINSLSEDERANFLNFVREKTKNLSQEVNDIEAWLAHTTKAGQNRWEVYYKKFVTCQQAESKKSQSSRGNQMKKFQEELEQQRQQAMSMCSNTV
ncbi:hypothetical protein [Nostoc sp.]